MAGKIFVNYRRDDSAAHALNVAQYLEREFGAANVFLDIDRLRAGQKFPVVPEERLSASKVMLAIIGPHWLTITNEQGRRRLDDPEDWVRLEISRALARGVDVIPVLVGGASLPRKSDLPDDLKPLVEHQVATITTNGFRNEMAGLARDVRALLGPRRRGLMAGFAALAACAALALAVYAGVVPWPGSTGSDPRGGLTPSTAPGVRPSGSDPAPSTAASAAELERLRTAAAKAEEDRNRIETEAAALRAEAEARQKAEEKARADAEAERQRLAMLAAEEEKRRKEVEAKAADEQKKGVKFSDAIPKDPVAANEPSASPPSCKPLASGFTAIDVAPGDELCDPSGAHRARVDKIGERVIRFTQLGGAFSCNADTVCQFAWPGAPPFRITAEADPVKGIAPRGTLRPR